MDILHFIYPFICGRTLGARTFIWLAYQWMEKVLALVCVHQIIVE